MDDLEEDLDNRGVFFCAGCWSAWLGEQDQGQDDGWMVEGMTVATLVDMFGNDSKVTFASSGPDAHFDVEADMASTHSSSLHMPLNAIHSRTNSAQDFENRPNVVCATCYVEHITVVDPRGHHCCTIEQG